MSIARGTVLLGLAPVALGLGLFPAMVTLVLLVGMSLGTSLVFDSQEKQEISQLVVRILSKWWPFSGRPIVTER